jgi:hypothetical protein
VVEQQRNKETMNDTKLTDAPEQGQIKTAWSRRTDGPQLTAATGPEIQRELLERAIRRGKAQIKLAERAHLCLVSKQRRRLAELMRQLERSAV